MALDAHNQYDVYTYKHVLSSLTDYGSRRIADTEMVISRYS